MSHIERWVSLSARIRALGEAGQLFAQFQAVRATDDYNVGRYLAEQCRAILIEMDRFRAEFETVMPLDVNERLGNLLEDRLAKVIRQENDERQAKAGMVFLLAVEAELTDLFSNRQELIRARSERAFLHLQRVLAVDEETRAKWMKAFNQPQGEVACEKLGAVHLLWHGIYAFKVDASGARTDLVFGQPVDPSVDRPGIEGIVLTEWKKAEPKNAAKKYEEAVAQAELYSRGPLAGIELAGYRYTILVSENELPPSAVPANSVVGGVVYRHINITIAPDTPSRQAAKSRRK